jgi:hypothetical protein
MLSVSLAFEVLSNLFAEGGVMTCINTSHGRWDYPLASSCACRTDAS